MQAYSELYQTRKVTKFHGFASRMPLILARNVETLCHSRGLSQSELASRLDLPPAELSRKLHQARVPKGLIKRLSTELVVSDVFLFMDGTPAKSEALPDFRSTSSRRGSYQLDTLKAIQFSRTIREVAIEIRGTKASPTLREMAATSSVSKAAKRIRKALNLTAEVQLETKDANAFFKLVRKRAENNSLFILQSSFSDGSGFCLSGENNVDVITLNTFEQSFGRRLFSLAHEFYHCILQQPGLSDAESQRISNVERTCNAFAAELLMPSDLVAQAARGILSSRELNLAELNAVAKRLKTSNHATMLRLRELDFYDQAAVSKWYQLFGAKGQSPDVPKKRRGGRASEEWKNKLARYGFGFAEVFGAAVERGDLDELEVFRIARLKPKYQADFFENATRASAQDAADS